jgi:hypothetical protein
MKANAPHEWVITLLGKRHHKRVRFIGRLDEALAKADELESNVRWVVHHYVVSRGKRVKEAAA